MSAQVSYDPEYSSVAKVPHDLHPRIRDFTSVNFNPAMRHVMFRSQHFSLGLDASQDFLNLTAERFRDLRDDLAGFAPHPFENYSFTFWVGDAEGRMVECMCVVSPAPASGSPTAGLFMMRWGDEGLIDEHSVLLPRQVCYNDINVDEIEPSYARLLETAKTAWKFVDVFRLLMIRQNGVTINQGGATRAAVRGGKRVRFYSASEITIDLDAVKDRHVTHHTGHGKSPSAYQYRAHLCHSGGRQGCDHFWIEIGGRMDLNNVWTPDAEHPRPNATWECFHCGRHRWHRRAGIRGDASKGFVRQTYKVVKGENDFVPA